jgi:hypothetical protein
MNRHLDRSGEAAQWRDLLYIGAKRRSTNANAGSFNKSNSERPKGASPTERAEGAIARTASPGQHSAA